MTYRILAIALLLVASLNACGSTQYLLTVDDGRLITSYGEPELDSTTQMYSYKDHNGVVQRLPASQVKQVLKR